MMNYYRYLFLLTGIAYLGVYFLSDGLYFTDVHSNELLPVTRLDPGFLNENLSLLMVAASAILTFIVLSVKNFDRDGLVLVTVLSFLLQFGAFTWLEQGSLYATALGMNNLWLLAGLVFQSVILVVIVGVMTFR